MENTTMTKRDFYTAVISAEISDELTEFAQNELGKLDAANAKRREAIAKKTEENAPLLNSIYEMLAADEPATATDIGGAMEISVQKASSMLKKLVEAGRANVTDVKIKGKRPVKGYTRV